MSLVERVDAYVKADRQWFRSQRIAHARRQIRIATDPNEKAFWREVLNRNKWREFRGTRT